MGQRERLPDLYWPDGSCRLWYRLIPDGADLCLNAIGEPATSVDLEVHCEPPEPDMPFRYEKDSEGHEYPAGRLAFAFEHGIAPWQPFAVHFEPTRCWQSYEGEWDSVTDHAVAQIAPWSAASVLRSWERFMSDRVAYLAQDALRRRDQRLADLVIYGQRRRDVSKMSLTSEPFWTNYFDGAYPDSLRVWLCSSIGVKNNWGPHRMFSGECREGGDWNRAMADLIEKVKAELPGISADAIRALPRWHRW